MVTVKSMFPSNCYSTLPLVSPKGKTLSSMVRIPNTSPNSCTCLLTSDYSGLHITANRLFGPQPHTSTYVCIWEIQISSVKAILSSLKARILGAAGSAFGYGFADPLNAPASDFAIPADPDGMYPFLITRLPSSPSLKSPSSRFH